MLVKRNLKLAHKWALNAAWQRARQVASGWPGGPGDFAQTLYEEYLGHAFLGLVAAAQRYDPRHDNNSRPGAPIQFSTFAYYCVRSALRDAAPLVEMKTCRTRGPGARVVLVGRMGSRSAGAKSTGPAGCRASGYHPLDVPDHRAGPDEAERDQAERLATEERLRAEIEASLSPRRAVAVILRVLDGRPLAEVGAALGVTMERVRQLVAKGLAELGKDEEFIRRLEESSLPRTRQWHREDFRGPDVAMPVA